MFFPAVVCGGLHVLVSAAAGNPPPASADTPAGQEPSTIATPPEGSMVFPLAEVQVFSDTFGQERPGGRRHGGIDLIAAKGSPVLAAADGIVDWIQDGSRGRCCAVGIRHADGSRSLYMHLDNDTPGTDDGLRVGIAPDLRMGSALRRGTLVGWVGDSGNAETTAPHLHFELVAPGGASVNAFPVLAGLRPEAVACEPEREPKGVRAETAVGRKRTLGLAARVKPHARRLRPPGPTGQGRLRRGLDPAPTGGGFSK